MMKNYITNIDGIWYAFAGDDKSDQVYSIGSDNPGKESGGGRWVSRWNDRGIKYVASPSPSRSAAYSKARRHGGYGGEV